MVGIGKARIVNKAARDRHIVGNEKAVHGQKELPLMIRRVGVAARRLWVVFIQRRDQRQVFPLEKLRFDWLRPGIALGRNAEDLAAVSEQILVEVSAADDLVSVLIFLLHIRKQHLQLFVGDLSVGGIGGQVQVVQAERFSVIDRNARDAVAAVEVE